MARAESDRNLLFGILALQMDFITRDDLVGAMNAWVMQKHRSLEDLLQERGVLAPGHRALLGQLVEAHVNQHGGDAAASLAALSPAGGLRDDLASVAGADLDVQASLAALESTDPHSEWPATLPPSDRSVAASIGTPTAAGQRFRILRHHASGGLGEVYVARDEELQREVALKQIQGRFAHADASRSRFLEEAEITGGLEHPGIVPVYGLGHYPDGRPYYAMRFIRGDSLKQAIERFHRADSQLGRDSADRPPTLHQLLRRFLDVCNAMAYAHSRGILHRDLKPDNVMLGPFGETLVVDWGLAKPIGRPEGPAPSAEKTLRPSAGSGRTPTQIGSAIGTPAYMSPEQAEGRIDALGPASDVYSLGAILYNLLTGQVPVQGSDLGEVLRKVRQGDFPSPRQVNAAAPPALEAVCLKAMSREPGRRYASPKALADDVERWLDDKPVTAWREPFSVRVTRWARRHRTAMTGAAATLVAGLIGLAAVAAVQNQSNRDLRTANEKTSRALEAEKVANEETSRALEAEKVANAKTSRALEAETRAKRDKEQALAQSEEARTRAEGVLNFLKNDVLAAARPEGQPGGLGTDVTVRKAIDAADSKIAAAFKDQPIIEAAVRDTLGKTYLYLGESTPATRQLERAVELRTAKLGPDHADTLSSRNNLAAAYGQAGRSAEAIRMHEATLKLQETRLGLDDADALISRNNLAVAYLHAGRTADTIRVLEETIKIMESKFGHDHPKTLHCRNILAVAYQSSGRFGEAIRMHEETLSRQEAKLGPVHPDTLQSRNNLAVAYDEVGRSADAIRMHEETLKLSEAKLGPVHPDTLQERNNLAAAFSKAGRIADAIKLHEATLKLMESKLGYDHPHTLLSRNNLAASYASAGRTADAMRMHEETLRLREKTLGPDHPDTLLSRSNLALTYQAAGRLADAIRMDEETLRLREKTLGPDHPSTLTSRSNLAWAYQAAGRFTDAIRMDEETLKLRESKLGRDHPDTLVSRDNLALAYQAIGRLPEALRMHEETLRLKEAKFGPEHSETLTSRNNLAEAYRIAGHTAEAIKLHEEMLKQRESRFGHEHPDTLVSRNNLALAYLAAGRTGEAIRMFEETLELQKSKLGPDHPATLLSRSNLAWAYQTVGRLAEAIRLYGETLEIRESKLGPNNPYTLASRAYLSGAYVQAGRWREAEPLLRDSLARRRKVEKADSPVLASDLAMLGMDLLEQSKWSDAEPILRECLAIREKVIPDIWQRFNTMSQLGGALSGQGRYAEAEPLIVGGYEGMKSREDKIPPAGQPRLLEAAERVIRLYEAWEKPDKAAEWKTKLGLADLPTDVFASP